MFSKLANEFPEGKITDPGSFRQNKVIQNHGRSVVALLDEMITEFDNVPVLMRAIKVAVHKHILLKNLGMRGENFHVCWIFELLSEESSSIMHTLSNIMHTKSPFNLSINKCFIKNPVFRIYLLHFFNFFLKFLRAFC